MFSVGRLFTRRYGPLDGFVMKKENKKTTIDIGDFRVEVEKVPDQSGLRNVIQHTYYLKKDKNGTPDKLKKQRQDCLYSA